MDISHPKMDKRLVKSNEDYQEPKIIRASKRLEMAKNINEQKVKSKPKFSKEGDQKMIKSKSRTKSNEHHEETKDVRNQLSEY